MTTPSFRDPCGRVFLFRDQVYRVINSLGIRDFQTARQSRVLKKFADDGNLVGVSSFERLEAGALPEKIRDSIAGALDEYSHVAQHEKIPFQNFPFEWTPEMLYAAADLTLEMQQQLLAEGIGLKDATPYNIIFRGATPVFVDWLSFEARDARDPVWLPQAQFIRTFILPLLANKYFGLSLAQIFLASRDGIEPEAIYAMCGTLTKLRSPFLTMVTIPKILARSSSGKTAIYQNQRLDDAEKAQFILRQQLKYLRRLLEKVAPDAKRTSDWAEYLGPRQHFTGKYLRTKHEFVEAALREFAPQAVLDVGCNTGYFSRVAAASGASVLAIDFDPIAVGRVWRMATAEKLNILPLVQDISRPSPGVGWRNAECAPFLSRVEGKFDAVIMLAVIHHLLVTERVPLAEILKLIAETTDDLLILEFVPPDDPMFRQIARGRDHLFEYLTESFFEEACSKHFKILKSEKPADSRRRLYLLQK